MRISDWSSDVCSSDLTIGDGERKRIMGRSIWVLAVALGVTLGACRAMVRPLPQSAADAPPPEATGTWRATATASDNQRIRGRHTRSQAALPDARPTPSTAPRVGEEYVRRGTTQRSPNH